MALVRLIHTSDWHLGQTLHGQDRDHEHAQFLAWLLDQLVVHRADALLIAGDVFDTVNPPLKAQERLYDFIVRAHEKLPQLDIVMIAGNHDSGGRIELPAPLMKRLNAHAVGRISWVAEGQLDHQRLLVPLHDAAGNTAAWCLTLPFLRPAEVTGMTLGDDYMAGIRQVHERLIAAAEAVRQPGQALVAMSHAHMAGGAVSEESERNIVIGNAEALPASLFPESVAYVALGHLHKPQQVAGTQFTREVAEGAGSAAVDMKLQPGILVGKAGQRIWPGHPCRRPEQEMLTSPIAQRPLRQQTQPQHIGAQPLQALHPRGQPVATRIEHLQAQIAVDPALAGEPPAGLALLGSQQLRLQVARLPCHASHQAGMAASGATAGGHRHASQRQRVEQIAVGWYGPTTSGAAEFRHRRYPMPPRSDCARPAWLDRAPRPPAAGRHPAHPRRSTGSGRWTG